MNYLESPQTGVDNIGQQFGMDQNWAKPMVDMANPNEVQSLVKSLDSQSQSAVSSNGQLVFDNPFATSVSNGSQGQWNDGNVGAGMIANEVGVLSAETNILQAEVNIFGQLSQCGVISNDSVPPPTAATPTDIVAPTGAAATPSDSSGATGAGAAPSDSSGTTGAAAAPSDSSGITGAASTPIDAGTTTTPTDGNPTSITDPLVNQLAQSGDPTLAGTLVDASSQLSPQGYAQLEQYIGQNYSGSANDNQLMNQALTQAGLSPSDASALQTVLQTDMPQSLSSGDSTGAGSDSSASSSQTSIANVDQQLLVELQQIGQELEQLTADVMQMLEGAENGSSGAGDTTGSGTSNTSSSDGGAGTTTAGGSDSGTGTGSTTAGGSDSGTGTGSTTAGGSDSGTGTGSTTAGGSDSGSTPTNATGQFQVENGQIIGPDGQPFVIKGMNVDAPGLPTALANVDNLANNWGVNEVRIDDYHNGINIMDANGNPNFQQLNTIVNDFTSKGIVVQLDGSNPQAGIFTGQSLAAQENFYQQAAAYYKNNPYVWFGTSDEAGGSGGNSPGWLNETTGEVGAVRGTGNTNPIVVDDTAWSNASVDDPGQSGLIQNASTLVPSGNLIGAIHAYTDSEAGIESGASALKQAGYAPFVEEYGQAYWGSNGWVSNPSDPPAVIAAGKATGLGMSAYAIDTTAVPDSVINSDGTPGGTFGQEVYNYYGGF